MIPQYLRDLFDDTIEAYAPRWVRYFTEQRVGETTTSHLRELMPPTEEMTSTNTHETLAETLAETWDLRRLQVNVAVVLATLVLQGGKKFFPNIFEIEISTSACYAAATAYVGYTWSWVKATFTCVTRGEGRGKIILYSFHCFVCFVTCLLIATEFYQSQNHTLFSFAPSLQSAIISYMAI